MQQEQKIILFKNYKKVNYLFCIFTLEKLI